MLASLALLWMMLIERNARAFVKVKSIEGLWDAIYFFLSFIISLGLNARGCVPMRGPRFKFH